ncbi:hypothetical protein GCM10010469_03600 [Streptomyces labedae]|uniref:Uncharacterized protein n=1 Tax=Streptomyces labedae TaxID=285569 RepID=A0ABP6QTM3_9ACTN
MPLLSSQARSLGRRAVIEFTFQVAMRMPHNLPAACDNARPSAVARGRAPTAATRGSELYRVPGGQP